MVCANPKMSQLIVLSNKTNISPNEDNNVKCNSLYVLKCITD